MSKVNMTDFNDSGDIAVVGLAGRFPGAKNLDELWSNLCNGTEAITHFSDDELINLGVSKASLQQPNFVKAGAIIKDIDLFDAAFFGYSPHDAEVLDPQQRIFLECVWEVLESAGYNPEKYSGLIGVYAGTSLSTYLLFNLLQNPAYYNAAASFEALLGNDKDFLSTRVSYKLNLRGPSLDIQTGCSTSLVAVHLACQSLLSYQCDLALAGGVSLSVPQRTGYYYQEDGIASPDGHCRAFDAQAKGTVFGNGAGVVALKRLAEARSDGDYIHAIIKGSAINNDGALKVGYTAPSVTGQAEVILAAQNVAEVTGDSISYIEAHGTGTALGDPVEIEALTRAFEVSTTKRGFCAIGSIKTNIGHLDAAAGIAGLIKTILALKHKKIPPSLHFNQPNPQINFANSPFYVNKKLTEWKAGETPRRAGVSSFGIGGTNAHVIVEEAPQREGRDTSPLPPNTGQILLLSAKTESALELVTTNFLTHLKTHPEQELADIAYTLQQGRKAFNFRRIIVCKEVTEVINALETTNSKQVFTGYLRNEVIKTSVVFMFPGQGSQRIKMTHELYETEPVFRAALDQCAEFLKSQLKLDLRTILYPEADQEEEAEHQLNQTVITQPALFAVEYALACLWLQWGVQPAAMLGHSIGEYVAACIAGVFSVEEALRLVVARGQLMQELPGGAMVSVPLGEAQVLPLLNSELALAAVNGPQLCVVAGSIMAIENLEEQLRIQGLAFKRLKTSHAFHSNLMSPIEESFRQHLDQIKLKPPQIPYISNVSGTWISPQEATDPDYWIRHLKQTVRFSQGLDEIFKEPGRILLELGPGQTLTSLARVHSRQVSTQLILPTLPVVNDSESELALSLVALGRLWLAGINLDWQHISEVRNQTGHRIPLPTYPFERQRYWIEPLKELVQAETPTPGNSGVTRVRKPDLTDWFYRPVWKQSVHLSSVNNQPTRSKACWLLFADKYGLATQLRRRLEQCNQEVITVLKGSQFARTEEGFWTVNPSSKADYISLVQELTRLGKTPDKLLHLWSLTKSGVDVSGTNFFEEMQASGFYSLIFLAQAFEQHSISIPCQFWVLSNGVCAIESGDELYPEKSTILGPCKVIPQEYSNIECRFIDLPASLSFIDTDQAEKLNGQLLNELFQPSADRQIAYREKQRWLQFFETFQLDGEFDQTVPLRPGGVYLITGGLGKLGIAFATYMARTVRAKLILASQTKLPPPEEWEDWLVAHPDQSEICSKIQQLRLLEQLGAEIMVSSLDMGNADQVQTLINQIYTRFGTLNGVIYSAGLAGEKSFCIVSEVNQAQVNRHFQSKVYGLLNLEKALRGKELDFCLLQSSLAAILGGFGLVNYCAANLFMDGFAQKQNQLTSYPWLSVNWDSWQRALEERPVLFKGGQLDEFAIQEEEGLEVFRRLLSYRGVSQIAISTGDLMARFRQWIEKPVSFNQSKPATLHQRPMLQNSFVAPRNNLEQAIAGLWCEALGLEQVGIEDNFFELGGHSLIATMLISNLRKTYQVELPLRSLFEKPTIAGLAEAIEQVRNSRATNIEAASTIRPRPREAYRVKRAAIGEAEPANPALISSPESTVNSKLELKPLELKPLEFSLFFFSADGEGKNENKYHLLKESAKLADQNKFSAIWTPERHFNAFGGLYPTPSVTSAALAMITKQIQLRAGSVILPLHNTLRVAEEWAVIDNLSGGRVALAFGSGWHSDDFVLAPHNYPGRKELMFEGIDQFKRLWRGEKIKLPNGTGQLIEVQIFPNPVQSELPVWLTCTSTQTYIAAGQMGANVLTSLLYQDIGQLAEKIALYREARKARGYDPLTGTVTLMVHTLVGDDLRTTQEIARQAYQHYLRKNLDLQASNARGLGLDIDLTTYGEDDLEVLLDNACDRLLNKIGLIGTPESCQELVNRFKTIGVTELACLIDFGVSPEIVLANFNHLVKLKEITNTPIAGDLQDS